MESNRFSLSSEQTSSLLGQLGQCVGSSDFDTSVDLCTISDILWSIIHRQKEENPELYKALNEEGIVGLSDNLSSKSYKLYNDELNKTTSTITDVSTKKINENLKECFKTLASRGVE